MTFISANLYTSKLVLLLMYVILGAGISFVLHKHMKAFCFLAVLKKSCWLVMTGTAFLRTLKNSYQCIDTVGWVMEEYPIHKSCGTGDNCR